MKVSELKEIIDALGRFATVRESKDETAINRIGVQAGGGRLKLIASDGKSGLVVDVVASTGRFGYYIEARPLFQGAKVLTAKEDIEIIADENQLVIRTSKGGRITLKSKGMLQDAGFATKPKKVEFAVLMDESWQKASKLFPAVTKGDEKLTETYGTIHLEEEWIHISFVEPRTKTKYASYSRKSFNSRTQAYIAPSGFFEAMKVIGGNGEIGFADNGLVAKDDKYTLYTSGSQELENWPVLAVQGEPHSFTMERKKLIEILKGQVPSDEYGRVVLSWKDDSVEVRPYGQEGDGQIIACKTVGHGLRGVNANLLLDMLQGMDEARVVSVCITDGAPAIILRAKEYEDWLLMVAPLVVK